MPLRPTKIHNRNISATPQNAKPKTPEETDHAIQRYMNKGVSHINYGDTISILSDPNAGYWKYVWLATIIALLAFVFYQVIGIVIQLLNEETGTKISFEGLTLDMFQEKFKAKICFKSWPKDSDAFREIFIADMTYPEDKYWKRDWILATYLLRPGELGWVVEKTMGQIADAKKDEFSKFVSTTGNITVFDSAGYGGLKKMTDTMLTRFYSIARLDEGLFRNLHSFPTTPTPTLMEGPSHQLCTKHPIITPSFLTKHFKINATDEQFKSYLFGSFEGYVEGHPQINKVRLRDWLFTFYGGDSDSELSGNHFHPVEKESAFYEVFLKRYEYLSTDNRKCIKPQLKALYPKGFAQTICQNKCWWKAFKKTFSCDKESILQHFKSPSLKCSIPEQFVKSSKKARHKAMGSIEDDYKNEWLKCVFDSSCHEQLFCTEWEMQIKEFEKHPFRWMCQREDGSFNSDDCVGREQILLFSSQVEVIQEYKLHSISSVLSDSGGQIGLWIGLSVLEILKMIFFWILTVKNSKNVKAKGLQEQQEVEEQEQKEVDEVKCSQEIEKEVKDPTNEKDIVHAPEIARAVDSKMKQKSHPSPSGNAKAKTNERSDTKLPEKLKSKPKEKPSLIPNQSSLARLNLRYLDLKVPDVIVPEARVSVKSKLSGSKLKEGSEQPNHTISVTKITQGVRPNAEFHDKKNAKSTETELSENKTQASSERNVTEDNNNISKQTDYNNKKSKKNIIQRKRSTIPTSRNKSKISLSKQNKLD